jgi:hypothetical protein
VHLEADRAKNREASDVILADDATHAGRTLALAARRHDIFPFLAIIVHGR